jgi:hypothetical protein
VVRFAYFMIRVRQHDDQPSAPTNQLSGIVAHLGTSERRDFESADELLHLMKTWSESPPNLHQESGPRNAG